MNWYGTYKNININNEFVNPSKKTNKGFNIMTWNYRVVIKNGVYDIHECYYDGNNHPVAITENAIYPEGNLSLEDLQYDFRLMKTALEKPVLKYEDFNYGTHKNLLFNRNTK